MAGDHFVLDTLAQALVRAALLAANAALLAGHADLLACSMQ